MFLQSVEDQGEKRSGAIFVESPSQMLLTLRTSSQGPGVTRKPGELQGWGSRHDATRGPTKTAEVKQEAMGIEKGVLVAAGDGNALLRRGDGVPTGGANQTMFGRFVSFGGMGEMGDSGGFGSLRGAQMVERPILSYDN